MAEAYPKLQEFVGKLVLAEVETLKIYRVGGVAKINVTGECLLDSILKLADWILKGGGGCYIKAGATNRVCNTQCIESYLPLMIFGVGGVSPLAISNNCYPSPPFNCCSRCARQSAKYIYKIIEDGMISVQRLSN